MPITRIHPTDLTNIETEDSFRSFGAKKLAILAIFRFFGRKSEIFTD